MSNHPRPHQSHESQPPSASTPPTPAAPIAEPLHARLGDAPFAMLAERLYARIDGDARIRRLFPPDLSAGSAPVADMREFLIQFFGGASAYSDRKGHPRLRARHMRFPIDQSARDAWLSNALAALDEVAGAHALDEAARAAIAGYLVRASQFMVNA